MKMNGKEYGYRIDRYKSNYGEFEHIDLSIKPLGWASSSCFDVTFHFQSEPTSDYWYGGKVTIEGDPGHYDFSDSVKILNKIMELGEAQGVSAYAYNNVLTSLMERLNRLKIARVVYDGRISEYVHEKECRSSSFSRWCDDYHRLDNSSVNASVITDSEEGAKRQIRADLAAKHDGADLVKAFIDAGEPVFIADRGPTWDPLDKMIALPGNREAVAAE